MIREVSGDILLTQAQVIAHGIAPYDNFAQGLALSLREMWPDLYKDFRHYCHQQNPKEGELWSWRSANGPWVVNLFTQQAPASKNDHPGRAHTEYVNKALRELKKLVEKEQFTSIALPRLATGVGGLEWTDVQPLIKKHLAELTIPVIIYTTYLKGKKASET
jgi:O-acetyl-ADP-ribose deacetylase (regulator of RNase III)